MSMPQRSAMAERWGMDMAQGLKHAQLLMEKGRLLDGLWADVYKREAPTAAPDVDEDLYGGFVGPEDRRALQRLLAMSPEQMTERAAQGKLSFNDARLDELVFRYRARNWPESLSAAEQERWQAHCAKRLHEGEGGLPTVTAFFDQLDQLNETADERGQDLLAALYDYAEQIAPSF